MDVASARGGLFGVPGLPYRTLIRNLNPDSGSGLSLKNFTSPVMSKKWLSIELGVWNFDQKTCNFFTKSRTDSEQTSPGTREVSRGPETALIRNLNPDSGYGSDPNLIGMPMKRSNNSKSESRLDIIELS